MKNECEIWDYDYNDCMRDRICYKDFEVYLIYRLSGGNINVRGEETEEGED